MNHVIARSLGRAYAPAAPDFNGLTRMIGAWFAERRRIGRIEAELRLHSDRDLADMGLSRGDIPAVARGQIRRG